MTKPVTSVAAMMLYEEGAFELNDPISKWLPEFAETRVYVAGSAQKPVTAPQIEPIRVWHLLTHTSGLTYGFHHAHPVDAMYRAMGHEWGTPPGADSAEVVPAVGLDPAGLPARHRVELRRLHRRPRPAGRGALRAAAGRVLRAAHLRARSACTTRRSACARTTTPTSLARLYGDARASPAAPPTGHRRSSRRSTPPPTRKPAFLSGGGGLVSTAGDYLRFVELLRRGGSYDGGRLLGPRTIAHMVRNHLPGNPTWRRFGRPLFAETPLRGVGFGLGFSMIIDPVRYGVVASPGDYSWGGAASTAFYVDPVEDVTVSFYTQLLPSSTLPIRNYLRALVNQALVD